MEKQRTHYSREFKLKAVELSNERGNVSQVAQELNVSYENLKRWKKEMKAGRFNEAEPVTKNNLVEEELRRLRKELYETKLERDIGLPPPYCTKILHTNIPNLLGLKCEWLNAMLFSFQNNF